MKKILLGVLALTSVASFSDVTGYLKSDSTAEAKNTLSENKTLEVASFPLETKLDLGFFFDGNKDSFVFAGTKFKGTAPSGDLSKFGYAGVRLNTKVSENEMLTLNLIASNDTDGVEGAVKEHLTANKVWDDEKKKDLEKDYKSEDKESFYKEQGYVLAENDRLLLSALLNGKYDTSSYTLGAIYNVDDAMNSKFEALAKGKKELGKVELSANLNYLLGHQKAFKVEYNELSMLADADPTANLKYAGKIKGDVKVSTDKLVDKLHLHSKAYFNLGTVFATEATDANIENQRLFKVGLENEALYKGIKNVEIKAQLNYDAQVNHLPLKENVNEVLIDGLTHKGNAGQILSLPNVVLNAKYDNGKLMASTENKNTLYVLSYLAPIFENTDAQPQSSFVNKFETKNKLNYKFTDVFSANAVADYTAATEFEKNRNTTEHGVMAGFGLNYDSDTLKSQLNARYMGEFVPGSSNKIYANLRNELKLMANKETTVTGTLNAFNMYVVEGATGTFGTKAGVKVDYSKDKWMANAELNAKFLLGYVKLANKSFGLSYLAGAQLKTGLSYMINDNYKLGAELDNVYSYKLQNTLFDRFDEGINRLMTDNFETSVKKSVEEYITEKKDDIDKENEVFKKGAHLLDVMPKVNAELKFGKVVVKPEVGAKFRFIQAKLSSLEGKGKLNIEYRW